MPFDRIKKEIKIKNKNKNKDKNDSELIEIVFSSSSFVLVSATRSFLFTGN